VVVFSVLIDCVRKNLATLDRTRPKDEKTLQSKEAAMYICTYYVCTGPGGGVV
jgi:hypothetical protein